MVFEFRLTAIIVMIRVDLVKKTITNLKDSVIIKDDCQIASVADNLIVKDSSVNKQKVFC